MRAVSVTVQIKISILNLECDMHKHCSFAV